MQSKITIEVDFENGNEPIIQIISRQSDDVRDKLIRYFIELLGHESTWCKIYCVNTHDGEVDKFQRWKISPIKPSQFSQEAKVMIEQDRLMSNSTITYNS
jgi:hypothetical protein